MKRRYQAIVERMKKAGDLKNDSALARKLGVTPQALSNYKKRDAMPPNLILSFADMTGTSIDWLVYGGDDMERRDVKRVRTNTGTPGHFPAAI